MSSPFTLPSQLGGGAVFKPGEHMNDLAILVEPTQVFENVPNTYNGTTKNRDEVLARVTIFGNSESLATRTPTEVIESTKFVHGMLTSSLKKIVGGATVSVVRKVPTQAGSGYAFRDVEPSALEAVTSYYTEREAAVAEALNDLPSFD